VIEATDAQHELPEDVEGVREKNLPPHQMEWPLEWEGCGAVLETPVKQGEEEEMEEAEVQDTLGGERV